MSFISLGLAFLFLSYACYTDVKNYKIPNLLSIGVVLVGIFLFIIKLDFIGLIQAGICALLIFVSLFFLYLLKGLGAGDVKLLASLAFLVEFKQLFTVLVYSFLIAGIIAIIVYMIKFSLKYFSVIKGEKINKLLNKLRVKTLPFNYIKNLHQIPFMLAVLPAFITNFIIEVLI